MPVERHHVVDIPLGFPKRRDSIVTGNGIVTGVVCRQRQLEVAAIPVQVSTQDTYGRVDIPNGIGGGGSPGPPPFPAQQSPPPPTSPRPPTATEHGRPSA